MYGFYGEYGLWPGSKWRDDLTGIGPGLGDKRWKREGVEVLFYYGPWDSLELKLMVN